VRVAAKFKLRRMGGVVFPFDCCGGVWVDFGSGLKLLRKLCIAKLLQLFWNLWTWGECENILYRVGETE
jgi:hypothetical protein